MKNTPTIKLNPDLLNDLARAEVARQFPRPIGGFETDEQEQEWKEAQESLFYDLTHPSEDAHSERRQMGITC